MSCRALGTRFGHRFGHVVLANIGSGITVACIVHANPVLGNDPSSRSTSHHSLLSAISSHSVVTLDSDVSASTAQCTYMVSGIPALLYIHHCIKTIVQVNGAFTFLLIGGASILYGGCFSFRLP